MGFLLEKTEILILVKHSDRDPIFYRWHSHVEDICQQYRDNKLPSYSKADFTLSDGVRIVGSEAWKY